MNYPAVLLTHGVNDPRVEVWQSPRSPRACRPPPASGKPVLLRLDYDAGHGIGETKTQRQRRARRRLGLPACGSSACRSSSRASKERRLASAAERARQRRELRDAERLGARRRIDTGAADRSFGEQLAQRVAHRLAPLRERRLHDARERGRAIDVRATRAARAAPSARSPSPPSAAAERARRHDEQLVHRDTRCCSITESRP